MTAFDPSGSASAAFGADGRTIFEVASMSKPIAAYVTLALVAQGALDLDVPLVGYSRALAPDDDRIDAVTARHVLTHRTGLWCDQNPGPLYFEKDPDTGFKYSNAGFNFLQAVVEDAFGESFDALAQRLVFDPLEMASSSYVWRADYDDRTALPHDGGGAILGEKWRPDVAWAPGSVHSTPDDYARFLRALLQRDGPVPRELVDEMLSPQVEVHESWEMGPPASGSSWGLGIGLQSDSFWHWGSNEGFKSFAAAWPEDGAAIVVMTNADRGLSIAKQAVRAGRGADHPAFEWLGALITP